MSEQEQAGSDAGARRIQEVAMGYYRSQALYVAARLGIADLLEEGPRSAGELAAAAGGVDPDALLRVLRLLVDSGIFDQDPLGRFQLNPAGRELKTHGSGSMKDLAEVFGEEFYLAFGNLLETVRTGRDAFSITFGRGLFEYLEEHPERARAFDRAMAGGTVFFRAIPDVYAFSPGSTVVDVGGGNGALLRAILSACPQVRGVLFDTAPVVAAAASHLSGGLGDRVEAVAGDFFREVVGGGDYYLLSRVLHDWTDARCLTVLANCRRAMNAKGRLLVVERLLPGSYATATDANMMAVTGGRERSVQEFGALLEASGFRMGTVTGLPLQVSLLEALPR